MQSWKDGNFSFGLMKSSRRILVIFIFLLWQGESNLRALSPLTEAWKTGDEKVIYSYSLYPDSSPYLKLSDTEIAELAFPIAHWIPFVSKPEITLHNRVAFFDLSPDDYEKKKRDSLALYAAWFIRVLAEQDRLKHESQVVIPELIEGLDNPNVDYVGRDCYYALVALTGLYDHRQPVYEHNLGELATWYRKWWEANSSKDLIVDDILRERIKGRLLRVCARIEAVTASPSNAFHGFRTPASKDLNRDGEALYGVEYWPASEFSGVNMGRHGNASWIWIGIVSQSSLITTIPSWNKLKTGPEDTLPARAKLIYKEPIPNSDWQIEIYTKDTPPADDLMFENSLKGGG